MVETFLESDNLSGFFKARVIENIDPSGEAQLGLFIPDLMPNITNSDAPLDLVETLKLPDIMYEGHDDFKAAIKTTAQITNYIWCRPASALIEIATAETAAESNIGGSFRVPRLGTWVTVFFDNEDPNKRYYLPFSMTAHGEKLAGTLLGKSSLVEPTLENWTSPEAKILIEVLTEHHNQNVIYIDNNVNVNAFVLQWANGHEIVIHHAEESGIRIMTEKGHTFHMDENSTEISINTHNNNVAIVYNDENGTVDINNTGNYTQKTGKNLVVNVGENATIKSGKDTTIDVGANATIKSGADTTVNASGNVTIKSGGDISASAGGNASIVAGGAASVKGSPVSIN